MKLWDAKTGLELCTLYVPISFHIAMYLLLSNHISPTLEKNLKYVVALAIPCLQPIVSFQSILPQHYMLLTMPAICY